MYDIRPPPYCFCWFLDPSFLSNDVLTYELTVGPRDGISLLLGPGAEGALQAERNVIYFRILRAALGNLALRSPRSLVK